MTAKPSKAVTVRMEEWEKQPKESLRAFEAFALYRDLGAARSLAKVAKQLGKSKALMERWSRTYNWSDRTTAYEIHMERVRQEAKEDAIADQSRREMAISGAAISLALKRLGGDPDDPSVVPIHPNEMDPADTARMAELGIRSGRLALGQPTDMIKGSLAISPMKVTQLVADQAAIALEMLPRERHEEYIRRVEALAA